MIVSLKVEELLVIQPMLEATIKDLTVSSGFEFRPAPALMALFVERVTSRNMMVMVDDRKEPKGFLVCNMVPSMTTTDVWAAVLFLYVKPEARNKGLGTALLKNLQIVASAIGATRISVTSPKLEGAPTRKVYKKLGFQEIEAAFCLKL